MKQQAKEWQKIITNHISNKGLVIRKNKELKKFNSRKTNQFKTRLKDLNRRKGKDTWIAKRHMNITPVMKSILKLWYDNTTYLLELLKWKILTILSKQTFAATLCIVAYKWNVKWNQLKCPSIDEWKENWYIYTMEHCSSIKKNELLICKTIWITLKGIRLREGRQLQEVHLQNILEKQQLILKRKN